jgi:hypothetical protein
MKKLFFAISLFSFLILSNSYGQEIKPQIALLADSAIYTIDTVIRNLRFNNNDYLIVVAKDKYNDKQKLYNNGDIFFSPITVIIYDITTSKAVYSSKYDDNEFYFFINIEKDSNKDGRYYMGMLSSGGGSGYIGTLFGISFNDKPKLVKLFDFSELSHIAINVSGNEFLHLEGVWNFDENEAHFSNHRYIIRTHTINGETVLTKKLGKTKGKYSSFDEDMPVDEIFKAIFSKESKLVKNIDLNKFIIGF